MTKREACDVIKKSIETFLKMESTATDEEITETWDVVADRLQPQDEAADECAAEEYGPDDDDRQDEEGLLDIAGMYELPWDAYDVAWMLREGDTAAAMAEVRRLQAILE